MEATVHNFRQLLMLIPREFEYDHRRVRQVRACLRDILFKVATVNGKYIDWLSDTGIPTKDIKPENWIAHDETHSHYGRPCVRKLRRGEPTYRCLTCGLDETCVLCKYCYNEADHVGHNIFVKIGHRDDGGICDCGDHEAWKTQLHCKAEQGLEELQEVPDELGYSLLECFEICLDFVVDVISSAHPSTQFYKTVEQVFQNEQDSELDEAVYGAPDTKTDKYMLALWNDDRRSVHDAVLAIRFATGRPQDFGFMVANEVDSYGRGRLSVSADCNRLLLQKSTIKHFTSTIRSVRDYVREEMADEIVHWLNDMVQARLRNADPSFLTRLVGEALVRPWRAGVKSVRTPEGQSHPMKSGLSVSPQSLLKPDHALPLWRHALLNGIKVPTIDQQPILDVEFPAEEERALVASTQSLGSQITQFSKDNFRMGISAASCSIVWANVPPSEETTQADPRVKYLLFFDIRLWKSLRLVLCDLYLTSLVSDSKHKALLGSIYADIYPVIAELYVMVDREPEVSIITSLSTQLFTTPSIATELSTGPHFSHYFGALYTLFTQQQVISASKITFGAKLSTQSPIFRNRKLGQLFHEIEFLLNRNTNKAAVVGNVERVVQAADFLSLFQNLTPMTRQLDVHVEYENDSWVYFFTTMPFVHQLANAVANGALECSFEQVKGSISYLSGLLIRWAYLIIVNDLSGTHLLEANTLETQFANKRAISWFNNITVDSHPVSLHHPVHVFLSWLIEFAGVPSVEDLQQTLFGNIDEVRNSVMGPVNVPDAVWQALLFDGNLRAMGLLSQIHIGLWVRNGYAVRSQLTHYRETTLRDLAYSRDIFMAQVGLASLECNNAFVQLMHRYNMIEWRTDPLFDEDQRYYMLEEFLHLLTFLLCDRLHLLGLDETALKERLFEREIIQCLTFHAMSFSEMTKTIPESMLVCEDLFELVLKRCADFVPPKGVRDVGVYALKPEYLSKFDTHYTHFSQAKMDEAEQKIAEKVSVETGTPKAQVVHLPPLERLTGPWRYLSRFTRSVQFARFMYDLFHPFATSDFDEGEADEEFLEETQRAQRSASRAAARDHSETVLGKGLYLLLMAAQDDLLYEELDESDSYFSSVGHWIIASTGGDEPTFLGLLQNLLRKPNYHTLHPRIHRLLDLLHEKTPRIVPRYSGSSEEVGESEAERKKRRGKEMRAKALEDLRKQQALFKMNTDIADDDDDEMDLEGDDDDDDTVPAWEYPTSQCVLCQMPDSGDSIFGIMTYITESRTARTQPAKDSYWLSQAYSGNTSSLDVAQVPVSQEHQTPQWQQIQESVRDKTLGVPFPLEHSHITPVITGCGHGVHFKCYQNHIQQQRQRPGLTRATPENVAKVEYLCALCRGLNNAFMPVMWRPNRLSVGQFLRLPDCFREDYDKILDVEHGRGAQGSMVSVIEKSYEDLQPKFVEAFKESAGFNVTFSQDVHAAVLVSIMRLTTMAPEYSRDISNSEALIHAYSATIEGMEIALRGVPHDTPFGGIIVDQLSQQQLQFLRVFSQFLRNMIAVDMKRQLENEPPSAEARTRYPLFNGHGHDSKLIFPFRTYVESLYISLPMFKLNASALTRVFVAGTLFQILGWLATVPSLEGVAVGCKPSAHVEAFLRKYLPHDPRLVYGVISRHMTIALRRAALVVHGLCGVYDSEDYAGMMHLPEVERLCQFLRLASFDSIIAEATSSEWFDLRQGINFAAPSYGGVHQLIRLPERLDMFFNDPTLGDLPSDPTVCLFCGEITGVQTFERRGPCNRHVERCMKVYGIFLQPKRNMLLYLLPDQRGSFTEAPYLDLHGEIDELMRRGRPHYLQLARYQNLTRTIWLEHGLASFVARKLDATTNQGGWETL